MFESAKEIVELVISPTVEIELFIPMLVNKFGVTPDIVVVHASMAFPEGDCDCIEIVSGEDVVGGIMIFSIENEI